MRTTGLGLSTILIVAGAILAWAVTVDVEGVDLNQVGLIMFVVGIVLAVVTVAMALLGRRRVIESRSTSVGGYPTTETERDVVIDQNQPV